jgi:DNA-binding GntR family transcriptional regulator
MTGHVLEKPAASAPTPDRFEFTAPPRPPGRSLAEYAYHALRDVLREGRFKPGEHLPETDIARWLSISRTPVREAMQKLISEGLLANGRWNGAVVAEFDSQQVVELYAVRESLEGTAARLAARHASAPERDYLSDILAREAAAGHDPDRLVELNFEFHRGIYRAAHNRYLLQSLSMVVDALGLLRHSIFVLPGSAAEAHRDHVAMLDAIAAGRADHADQLARAHVRQALALRLKLPDQPA